MISHVSAGDVRIAQAVESFQLNRKRLMLSKAQAQKIPRVDDETEEPCRRQRELETGGKWGCRGRLPGNIF